MLRLTLLLLCLICAPSAYATDLAGTWDMVADGRVITRLELRRNSGGWSGIWLRPTNFTFDGNTFTNIEGPVVSRRSISARPLPTGTEISFSDPRPDSTPDIFRISQLDNRRALLEYVGLRYEPITLVRGAKRALGPWDRNGRYTRTVHRTDNPELAKIFDEDQADRENEKLSSADLVLADKRRREVTRQLLDARALSSGQDFFYAALILHHGGAPADYLWAHTLAIVAVARGNSDAAWLAAASLDRYLQAIGQPQVYGTQYSLGGTNVPTGTYDPGALPDSLRRLMGVPEFSKQDRRIKLQATAGP
jgi:hypothetical protein